MVRPPQRGVEGDLELLADAGLSFDGAYLLAEVTLEGLPGFAPAPEEEDGPVHGVFEAQGETAVEEAAKMAQPITPEAVCIQPRASSS